MTSWLILLLLGGSVSEAVEMPTSQCLTIMHDIEASPRTMATDANGRRVLVLSAICRPWPPLDPCACGEEVTQ